MSPPVETLWSSVGSAIWHERATDAETFGETGNHDSHFRPQLVGESTIRYALTRMKQKTRSATVIDALKVAHEISFELPAFMAEHETLRRLAFARSDYRGVEPIVGSAVAALAPRRAL